MTHPETPNPEPAWLTALADQRAALVSASLPPSGTVTIVMTPLSEPPEGSSDDVFEKWERTCDNCGKYVPPGRLFATGHLLREAPGYHIHIIFGACPSCAEPTEEA